jgi:hypothetical protein
MTDPCDMSDLIPAEKANVSLGWITDRIVPRSTGALARLEDPPPRGNIRGTRLTPVVGQTVLGRAHRATIANVSASTALELSVAASSRTFCSVSRVREHPNGDRPGLVIRAQHWGAMGLNGHVISQFSPRSPAVAVSVNDSPGGKLRVGDEPGRRRRGCPRPKQTF